MGQVLVRNCRYLHTKSLNGDHAIRLPFVQGVVRQVSDEEPRCTFELQVDTDRSTQAA